MILCIEYVCDHDVIRVCMWKIHEHVLLPLLPSILFPSFFLYFSLCFTRFFLSDSCAEADILARALFILVLYRVVSCVHVTAIIIEIQSFLFSFFKKAKRGFDRQSFPSYLEYRLHKTSLSQHTPSRLMKSVKNRKNIDLSMA